MGQGRRTEDADAFSILEQLKSHFITTSIIRYEYRQHMSNAFACEETGESSIMWDFYPSFVSATLIHSTAQLNGKGRLPVSLCSMSGGRTALRSTRSYTVPGSS